MKHSAGISALAVSALAGVGVGGFGAFAYYSSTLRPLAHTLGLWLLLTVLWIVLALLAGPLLGTTFCRIGTPGRIGALSWGTAAGLLVADVARRAVRYPNQADVLLVFLCLALAALWLRARPVHRDQIPVLILTLPVATLVGYLLVSTPDLIEEIAVRL